MLAQPGSELCSHGCPTMPRLPVTASSATSLTLADGRRLLAFAGCNYLGLAQHPRVLAAAAQGLALFGISTTASRETTGNTSIHDALECELASFMQQESAILTAEGYTANFAVAQGLAPTHGVALVDAKAHRSIRNAATAAGMQVIVYEHADPGSAGHLVKQHYDAGVAIFTDGVFAADGAIAPVAELLAVLPAKRATLVVDDCHGLTVQGPHGRGTVAAASLNDPRVVITTTLAKGIGCYGGAVVGRRALIRFIQDESDVYRRSTPVPTPIAMAARAAVALIEANDSLLQSLLKNAGLLRAQLLRAGVKSGNEGSPVCTFVLPGGASRMQRVHEIMLKAGVYAPLIEYPGGPADQYFRLTVTAAHSSEEIAALGDALAGAMEATGGTITAA